MGRVVGDHLVPGHGDKKKKKGITILKHLQLMVILLYLVS